MSIGIHISGYCKTINTPTWYLTSAVSLVVAWRGVGSIPTGDIYFHFDFFFQSQPVPNSSVNLMQMKSSMIIHLLWIFSKILYSKVGYRFNHTSWMTFVTPTDRPRSVRILCVIEVFGGAFVLSTGFRICCWYRDFRYRTKSGLLFVSD